MTEINETALVPHTGGLDVMQVGRILVACGFFPDVRSISQAAAKILAGQEVGLGPIASIRGVYIVNGTPSYSANIIASAIKRSRSYDYRIRRLDDEECHIEFFEEGQSVGSSTFTMKDAATARLTGDNWKKYPRNMLFSRALTNGARWYCPDVFGGQSVYTPDELGAVIDVEGRVIDQHGEIHIEPQPDELEQENQQLLEPEPTPQNRPSAPRSAAAPRSAPPPSQEPPEPDDLDPDGEFAERPAAPQQRVSTGPNDLASAAQRAYIERLLGDVGMEYADLRERDELRTLPEWEALTVASVPLAVNYLLKLKKAGTPA